MCVGVTSQKRPYQNCKQAGKDNTRRLVRLSLSGGRRIPGARALGEAANYSIDDSKCKRTAGNHGDIYFEEGN